MSHKPQAQAQPQPQPQPQAQVQAQAQAPQVSQASEYAIMKIASEDFATALRENVGGKFDIFALDRVRWPAGGALNFVVPTLEGDVAVSDITGVIVAWRDVRAYWDAPYTGGGVPPSCSSPDCITGYGNPGGLCAMCQFAQFGSARDAAGNPTRAQACKELRRLLVYTRDTMLPLLITLPPTSIAPCRRFFQRLATRGIPYYACIVRLGLAREKSHSGIPYAQLQISMLEPIPPEYVARFRAIGQLLQRAFETIPITTEDYDTTSSQAPADDTDRC